MLVPSSALFRFAAVRFRHSAPHLALVSLLVAVLLVPAVVVAQAGNPPPDSRTPNAAPDGSSTAAAPPAPFTAGWQNGFALQSANGDYRLGLGAIGQVDGRFGLDDPLPLTNTFTVRKARVVLSGRVAKYFDVRIVPDFGNGSPTLQDAYVDVRFSSKFRIRTGKDKTPVGYELLLSDPALLFPERSLASTLVPNRDIGVAAQGDLIGGKLSYSSGVFNGVPDGSSSTTEVDANSDKDFAGRIVVQPFRRTGRTASIWSGLGFHLGGSSGTQTGALPSFKTSVGQSFFQYGVAGTGVAAAVASGPRKRITPALFYYAKAFGVFGEYVRSTQAISRGAAARDVTNTAWDVSGVINLTGEGASSGVVTPARPFDPPTGRWGALQVVARYADLTLDDALFDAGFAAAGASRAARQVTIGANWYPVQFIKYYVNYEHTTFDRGAAQSRRDENAVFLRVQFAF